MCWNWRNPAIPSSWLSRENRHSGIEALPDVKTQNLAMELVSATGVELVDKDISIIHWLPATKKVKDWLIIKFSSRDKRDEFYKKHSNPKGRNTSILPNTRTHYVQGKCQGTHRFNKVHINESLIAAYRKQLFGRINSLKKNHNYKFVWTSNGKIHLCQSKDSAINTCTTLEQFEDHEDSVLNR